MSLLPNNAVTTIGNAILGVAIPGGISLAQYVQDEAANYKACCESIAHLRMTGVIDNSTAIDTLKAFEHTQEHILQNAHLMTKLLADQVVDAGLRAIGGVLNAAIGIKLFPA